MGPGVAQSGFLASLTGGPSTTVYLLAAALASTEAVELRTNSGTVATTLASLGYLRSAPTYSSPGSLEHNTSVIIIAIDDASGEKSIRRRSDSGAGSIWGLADRVPGAQSISGSHRRDVGHREQADPTGALIYGESFSSYAVSWGSLRCRGSVGLEWTQDRCTGGRRWRTLAGLGRAERRLPGRRERVPGMARRLCACAWASEVDDDKVSTDYELDVWDQSRAFVRRGIVPVRRSLCLGVGFYYGLVGSHPRIPDPTARGERG